MRKVFGPFCVLTGLMFVCAPLLIARAPYESTMGLVQKIFYFHVPSWFAMFTAIGICGVASLIHPINHLLLLWPVLLPSRFQVVNLGSDIRLACDFDQLIDRLE